MALRLRSDQPARARRNPGCFIRQADRGLLATEIPDVSVRADDVEIAQIVENILNNASEAIPGEGAIRISVGVEESMVRFDFEDTGSGMPPDVLTRVFEPFFTTRKGVGGHGLGLAGVKALCHAIGGRIEAASTEGVGSCFSVWIPLSDHETSATESVGRTASAVDSVMKPASGPLDGTASCWWMMMHRCGPWWQPSWSRWTQRSMLRNRCACTRHARRPRLDHPARE